MVVYGTDDAMRSAVFGDVTIFGALAAAAALLLCDRDVAVVEVARRL